MGVAFGVGRSAGGLGADLFHCPSCGGDREYEVRRRRTQVRGPELVHCVACAGTFPLAVLDVPTSERLEVLLRRGTRTAAAYLLTGLRAGGELWTPDQARRVLRVLRGMLGAEYGPELLATDLDAHREGSDLDVVRQLGDHVTGLGAEHLLRGLADLVLVLDLSAAPDWGRLGHVAAALDVSPPQLRGIVEDAAARARD